MKVEDHLVSLWNGGEEKENLWVLFSSKEFLFIFSLLFYFQNIFPLHKFGIISLGYENPLPNIKYLQKIIK
jgi:hypothetical protein